MVEAASQQPRWPCPCLLIPPSPPPARLRALPYDPLDVRCGAWHADFAAFRCAAGDLDQLLASVLGAGAGAAASLADRLDVVEGFARICTRDGLRWAPLGGAGAGG